MYEASLKKLNIHVLPLELKRIVGTYLDLKELVDKMWDLKLYIIDYTFNVNFFLYDLFSFVVNFFDPFFQNGFYLFNWKINYESNHNMTFFFAIKFCLAIGFLILIRGGTPRYRYDYLTKLGWLKFLGFIILVFLASLLTFFIF